MTKYIEEYMKVSKPDGSLVIFDMIIFNEDKYVKSRQIVINNYKNIKHFLDHNIGVEITGIATVISGNDEIVILKFIRNN